MMKLLARLFAALLAAAALAVPARAAAWLDETPRVAVISAFAPELKLLLARVQQPRKYSINGIEFTTGLLQDRPVVLFLCGISMANAAMNTQLVLERFKVTHLVVSGIAGGVNPTLKVGDVVVPRRWGQYLEMLMAREVAPGKFKVPSWMEDTMLPNFGMMYPRPLEVRSADKPGVIRQFWFDADPKMADAAMGIANAVELERCDADKNCLSHKPSVVVGGNGVSGQAFVDNAEFRKYTFDTFQANVLDMETAAVALVAYSNNVPYIAFRSLSDLAGGGEGENEVSTFFRIAADNSARVLLAFLAAWK